MKEREREARGSGEEKAGGRWRGSFKGVDFEVCHLFCTKSQDCHDFFNFLKSGMNFEIKKIKIKIFVRYGCQISIERDASTLLLLLYGIFLHYYFFQSQWDLNFFFFFFEIIWVVGF